MYSDRIICHNIDLFYQSTDRIIIFIRVAHYAHMEYIDEINLRILQILYMKWPYGVTGDEIIEHVSGPDQPEFSGNNLNKYMSELVKIEYVKIGDTPSALTNNKTRYYLAPTMYMPISENIEQPNSVFSVIF